MKNKILALFDPSKASWIAPIELLKPAIEVEYLWNYEKNQMFKTDSVVHHFNDFTSLYDFFERVSPTIIFFMSIDTGLSVAINTYAKSRGIKTYLLQHGYFGSFNDYKTIVEAGNQIQKKLQPINNLLRVSALSYLTKKKTYQFIRLVLFLSIKKNAHTGTKGWLGHFSGRRPDVYLLWSKAALDRFVKNDGAKSNTVRYIGNFETYSILKTNPKPIAIDNYLLLIDSPLSDNSYGLLNLTREEHGKFYIRLADYASSKGKKLVVKLHPEMYMSTWLPDQENIYYVRGEYPIQSLILQANFCFSFYSTLLITAVLLKPIIVFEIFEVSLTKFLKDNSICTVLDFKFDKFDALTILDNTKSDKISLFKDFFCGPIEQNFETNFPLLLQLE